VNFLKKPPTSSRNPARCVGVRSDVVEALVDFTESCVEANVENEGVGVNATVEVMAVVRKKRKSFISGKVMSGGNDCILREQIIFF